VLNIPPLCLFEIHIRKHSVISISNRVFHDDFRVSSRIEEQLPVKAEQYKACLLLVLLCLLLYVPGLTKLPPVDRDESRFAQATSQMLETGDYVRIRFQDEARNKKPVGIYWLQAASVALFGTRDEREIWPYRIPSLLGATLAVLLTFGLGRRLFDHRTGLLGAALCASSVLLVLEAHMATTDAVLLVTILAAQGALSRFYVREPDAPVERGAFLTFWIAQAIGILVKGPMTPLISLLTIGTLVAADRSRSWLKGLQPLKGLLIIAIIASPWAIAIGLATHGAFYHDAIGGDLLSKVASGQESHGFPPGYYLLLLPITLWPASFFIGPTLLRAWKNKSVPAIKFCLAWTIPWWIVLELVPTKIPHYMLPVYPALCLLIAATILAGERGEVPSFLARWVRVGFTACSLVIVFLGGGCFALSQFVDHRPDYLGLIPAAAGVATAVFSVRYFLHARYLRSAIAAVIGTVLVLGTAFQWILPDSGSLWLSRTAALAARQCSGRTGPDLLLASAGYHEPSLVFLLGTHIKLTSPDKAALFLRQHPDGLALVAAKEDDVFQREAGRLDLAVKTLGGFRGFNYSKGRETALRLYGIRPDRADQAGGVTEKSSTVYE